MGNNIILETKFVADISGSFYIPSYQRGYRWSETEVVRLLDDIYQNGKKNYCLQPVVVRKKEDQYELIDGQQRLTTLYLIYKYMEPRAYTCPAIGRYENARCLEKVAGTSYPIC